MPSPFFVCSRCKKGVVPVPSLQDRGQTWQEFLSLFRHGPDGVCTSCMLKEGSESAIELMREIGRKHEARRKAGFLYSCDRLGRRVA